MKYILYCGLFFFTACSNAQTNKDSVHVEQPAHILPWVDKDRGIKVDSVETGLQFDRGGTYSATKTRMNGIRDTWNKKLLATKDSTSRSAVLDSAGKIFTQEILNSIVPHWYGTPWDFDGYTAVPNEGVIACGYFVSTTMKDMGLNLDRYAQAQQTPENEAKTMACDPTQLRYIKFDQIYQLMKTFKEGLYFVGLQNHVGYLYVHNGNVYFIHSNYIDGQVVIENVETSRAFGGRDFYIADITHNKLLMEKWLTKQPLKVIKG